LGAQPNEAGEPLLRLRVLGMEFARWVVRHAAESRLRCVRDL
jgi:hypothetical protein